MAGRIGKTPVPSSFSKRVFLRLFPLNPRHERARRNIAQISLAPIRPANLDDVRRFRAAEAEEEVVRRLREVRRARAHLAELDPAVHSKAHHGAEGVAVYFVVGATPENDAPLFLSRGVRIE